MDPAEGQGAAEVFEDLLNEVFYEVFLVPYNATWDAFHSVYEVTPCGLYSLFWAQKSYLGVEVGHWVIPEGEVGLVLGDVAALWVSESFLIFYPHFEYFFGVSATWILARCKE